MGEGGALTIVMARHLDEWAECELVEERGVRMMESSGEVPDCASLGAEGYPGFIH